MFPWMRFARRLKKYWAIRMRRERFIILVDGHIQNLDLGQMIVDTIDSFGEVEGIMGEKGVPMSNEAAKALGCGIQRPGRDH